MSWDDRHDYRPYDDDPWRRFGRPGGDWQGMRPSFDNPLTWSLDLFRVWGIKVRVHIIFLIFVLVELLRAAAGPALQNAAPVDWPVMLATMVVLFVVVLLHEFGHCAACRAIGGEADEILMWPLGGLAYCRPGRTAYGHFITAAGGPLVNVGLCVIAGPLLGLMTGRWLGTALPNPLDLFGGLYGLTFPLQVLYLINALSLLLLLFNLLPIFPLDGGRLLQAALWPRMGYANSMRFAVRAGFIGAVLLGIFGAVIGDLMLIGIAIFGAVVCWVTVKQLEFTEAAMGGDGGEVEAYAQSLIGDDDDDDKPAKLTRAERRAQKEAERLAEESDRVDAILAKIAEQGMKSLSRSERKLLERFSREKRKRDGRSRTEHGSETGAR